MLEILWRQFSLRSHAIQNLHALLVVALPGFLALPLRQLRVLGGYTGGNAQTMRGLKAPLAIGLRLVRKQLGIPRQLGVVPELTSRALEVAVRLVETATVGSVRRIHEQRLLEARHRLASRVQGKWQLLAGAGKLRLIDQ
mgnify:CR=1 FL=1